MRSLLLLCVVVVMILGVVAWNTCLVIVPMNRVGVRSEQLGQGVEPQDFTPGYMLAIPFYHKVYLFDPTVQFLNFDSHKGSSGLGSVQLRGEDEYTTTLDISVLYRIKPGQAHQVARIADNPQAVEGIIANYARKLIWEELGKLKTEDFYNTDKRVASSRSTLDALNRALDEHQTSLEALDILIRNINYDERFEALLREKKELDQTEELRRAEAATEKEIQRTQEIERDTEALVIRIQQEKEREITQLTAAADKTITQIQADAQLYARQRVAEAENLQRQMVAEGELAKTEARAMGEKLINEAYQGFGGDLYIARQMIDNLTFGDIEINTNLTNPFDVNEMLKMLGVEREPRKQTQ